MNDVHPSFLELGVSPSLVAGLSKLKIEVPTPIQAASFPILMQDRNAYLQAETGTGKTLAYLLPIFARMEIETAATQSIIIAPTYELAIQIQRQCTDLAQLSGLPIRALLLIGGTSKERQIEKLKKKPQIVIGSPGRILELIQDRKLKAHTVKSIVVDEADRLLNPEGFPLLQGIVKATLKNRQMIFVSATDQKDTNQIVAELSPDVVHLNTSSSAVNDKIEHLFVTCEERDKPDLLRRLFHAMKPVRALVFVHRNETAEIVAEKLAHHKINAADIHAARDKSVRKQAMDNFRSGKVNVLIASDVAARGLDIKGVTHVFNLDMPSDSKAYLHRVGRTGRAGEKGTAVSLLTEMQARIVSRLKRELDVAMTQITLRQGDVYAVDE